jgi:2'-5' RNA ligase
MAYAISIKSAAPTALRLVRYWDTFGALEASPSMAALGYPPHVTLAVYDEGHQEKLRLALRNVFVDRPPIELKFRRLAFFDTPKFIVWAAPDRSAALKDVHAAIHRQLGSSGCRLHYQPSAWTPHCTLATNVTLENRLRAIAMATAPIEPFEVIFDCADCVEFSPVRVLEEVTLA